MGNLGMERDPNFSFCFFFFCLWVSFFLPRWGKCEPVVAACLVTCPASQIEKQLVEGGLRGGKEETK